MKLRIALNKGKHLNLLLPSGNLLFKTAGEYRFQNAVLEGACDSNDCIPVFLTAPGKKVFAMTSGAPESSFFNALYCLENDTVIKFKASQINIAPPKFRLAGQEVAIEIIDDYYRTNLNPLFKRFNKKRFPNPPTGWLSWYCYFNDFNEKKLAATIEAARRHFKDFGLEYIQLETWQKNSDKNPVFTFYHAYDPRKFPRGMRHAAEMIKKAGFKAGLWVVPFGTGEKEAYLKNPEMFLAAENGQPIKSWCGLYNLDPTHPGAKKYVQKMLKTMTRDWGYDYLKIDGLECGGDPDNGYYLDTLYNRKEVKQAFHKKEKDPLRGIAELIRKTIGPNIFFNVCAGRTDKTGKFAGIGDGGRIGEDVFYTGENPSWKAVITAAACTLGNYHVHNMFWYNDPDVLSIRDPLPMEHARMLCTIIGLSGQMLFLGDILPDLPQKKISLLQKVMPPLDTYPAHLAKYNQTRSSWFHDKSSDNRKDNLLQPIWNLIIRKPFEQWNVIAIFNWNGKEKMNLRLQMAEIGLDAGKQYLAYDFWEDKFIGIIKGAMDFNLWKQSCKVICLREKRNHPQLLSLNRHISQGAIGIASMKWNEKKLSLDFDLNLPPKREFILTLFVPSEYVLSRIHGNAGLKTVAGPRLAGQARCLPRFSVEAGRAGSAPPPTTLVGAGQALNFLCLKVAVRNGKTTCCFAKNKESLAPGGARLHYKRNLSKNACHSRPVSKYEVNSSGNPVSGFSGFPTRAS